MTLRFHFNAKSVFCVDLMGVVCVDFEHNYVKVKKIDLVNIVSDRDPGLLSGDIKLMRIFAAIRCIA